MCILVTERRFTYTVINIHPLLIYYNFTYFLLLSQFQTNIINFCKSSTKTKNSNCLSADQKINCDPVVGRCNSPSSYLSLSAWAELSGRFLFLCFLDIQNSTRISSEKIYWILEIHTHEHTRTMRSVTIQWIPPSSHVCCFDDNYYYLYSNVTTKTIIFFYSPKKKVNLLNISFSSCRITSRRKVCFFFGVSRKTITKIHNNSRWFLFRIQYISIYAHKYTCILRISPLLLLLFCYFFLIQLIKFCCCYFFSTFFLIRWSS